MHLIKKVFYLRNKIDGRLYCRRGTKSPSVWSIKQGATSTRNSIPKEERVHWDIIGLKTDLFAETEIL
jgi:hypothetical protein